MDKSYPVSHKDILLAPATQRLLPVPITYWDRLQERIRESEDPTAHLGTIASAALGSAVSLLAVAVSLPFSVEWSRISANIEHINWPAVATEGAVSFLGLLLLGIGCLTLYWASVKRKLLAKMGERLSEDMRDFKAQHTPSHP